MKSLFPLFLLTAAAAFAQAPEAPSPAPAPAAAQAPAPAPFPGLKIIMTPEEYARAGLDGLTPDQIGVIDAAIIRHYVNAVSAAATAQVEQMQIATQVPDERESFLSRIGLPEIGSDWANMPSVKARCTGWVTGNSFKLDNGQVWEGVEPIRMELSGREIEIQPRPNHGFNLVVDGKSTSMRVIRIK
jgi:hypothetical protein